MAFDASLASKLFSVYEHRGRKFVKGLKVLLNRPCLDRESCESEIHE